MKKSVAIEADKVRNLKFGINALIELEELLEKPLSSLSEGTASLADLRKLLFIGLKWEDKELTLDATGEIMDAIIEGEGMEYLSKKVGSAISMAMAKSTPSNA